MTRVLIVDDSATARAHLARLFEAADDFEVCGKAASTREALESLAQRPPDVVTLDVLLGPDSGAAADAVKAILAVRRVPIVLVSNVARSAPDVFDAIAEGAVELLRKPGANQRSQTAAFVATVREIAKASVLAAPREVRNVAPPMRLQEVRLLVVTASTGGPAALKELLSELPADYPAPVLVAQHLAMGFEDAFAEWLADGLSLPVRLARGAELLRPGEILVARPGTDLLVASGQRAFSRPAPPTGYHPSADALFASAARALHEGVACVVLSGLGSDGTLGATAVAGAGGTVMAQDRASSTVFGMPGACAAAIPRALSGTPRELGRALARRTRNSG